MYKSILGILRLAAVFCILNEIAGSRSGEGEKTENFANSSTLTSSHDDEEKLEDILKWEVPQIYRQNFPYYLSGFDKESNPVWVVEYGKWDVKSALASDPKKFRKFVDRMYADWTSSPDKYGKEKGKNLTGFSVIGDLNDYSIWQFYDFGATQEFYNTVTKFVDAVHKTNNFNQAYAVNVHSVFATLWGLARPLFADTISKVQTFGTNKNEYGKVLVRDLGKDAVPKKYR